MKKVVQDDTLLKEKRLTKKKERLIRNESERFRFANKGKPFTVSFKYFFTLHLKRQELVGNAFLTFSKHVDKQKMEEIIKNALTLAFQ